MEAGEPSEIESVFSRYSVHSGDGPVFTNPRLGPAITFLKDIQLISSQGLTDKGAQVVSGL